MKLLRVDIIGAALFSQRISICLNTSKGVRSAATFSEHDMPAYKIKPGIYTQVMLGLVGLNATGKTTVLELLSLVLSVLYADNRLNSDNASKILRKVMSDSQKSLAWEIYFLNENRIYCLKANIGYDEKSGRFFYQDENIWVRNLSGTSGSNIFEWKFYQKVLARSEEAKKSKYLKDDASIVMSVNSNEVFVASLIKTVNFNLPYWSGRPDQDLIKCFDPSIEELDISKADDDSNSPQVTIKFLRDKKERHSQVGSVVEMISSGTIKGLSILPIVMRALSTGGYVIMDELENHINKKIVEWLLGLFEDKRTNPYGACLIFSTHYPELLDSFRRNDNIYVTLRDENNVLQCGRFCEYPSVGRNELSKSRIILSNVIKGTAPKSRLLQAAKQRVMQKVAEISNG